MAVNEMKEFISKIVRKWKAYRYNVPFRNKVWYNYIAMFQRCEWEGKDYIEIFDEDDCYIDCPNIGGLVKYRYKGSLYLYKIVPHYLVDKEETTRYKEQYDRDFSRR